MLCNIRLALCATPSHPIQRVGERPSSRWRTCPLTLHLRPTPRDMPRTLCLCWNRTSRSSDLLLGHQQAMRREESSATGRDSRWPCAARTPYHGYGVTASRFNLQHPDDGSVCRVCARRPQRHSRTNPKVPKTLNSTFGKPTVTGIHQEDGPRRRERREAKGCSLPSQIS